MSKVKLFLLPLLLSLMVLSGCVSAGVDVAGHGGSVGVAPLGAGVEVH